MIRIEALHKSFGSKPVLKGVDLHIRSGETMAVIGQSGSGKSVMIKHIIGLLRPDRGRILVEGRDIARLSDSEMFRLRSQFGLLFQAAALFDSLTVAQNVAFGLRRYRKKSPDEVSRIVGDSLEKVGLRDVETLMPHELSGGMKKRVGLARAIAYDPDIILYDEPSTGIDPIRADAINDLIIQLQRDLKVTSVVITHDMTSACKVADRIAMLYNGPIVEVGTPEQIKTSNHPVVEQFIHGRAEGPIKEW